MRRDDFRRVGAGAVLAIIAMGANLATTATQAQTSASKAEESIGDLAEPYSSGQFEVQGIGLVIGLHGTGSDPAPSWERQKLLNELKRNPNVRAEDVLASTATTLVIVRGSIPVGVSTEDRWDVEVELPSASSGTTSLEGGYLLPTELMEIQIVGNGPMEGKTLAKVHGPILHGDAEDKENPRVGRVLGGARVRKEIPYLLLIRDKKHQSGRTAKLLEDAINKRFHQREGRTLLGMATAKTDKALEIRVPRIYHQNQFRYFQVIKQIPLVDNAALREQRRERWSKDLLNPETAGLAAVQLEAMGNEGIPVLKTGLEHSHPQVRFFAAEALAYLDESDAAPILKEAAIERPEFRTFALAALAAMDEPSATLRLRELMDEPEFDIRYSAFNALRTKDPYDPFLGRVRVLRGAPSSGDDDQMAMSLSLINSGHMTSQERQRREDPFELYVVASEGPPMVHVTRSQRQEIVLFGQQQELLPPMVLGGAGPILINASQYDDELRLSRIEAGREDMELATSFDLVEVIRSIAELGGTYPDVLKILEAAYNQANLPGAFLAESTSETNDGYDRAQIGGIDVTQDSDVQTAGLEEDSDSERRGLVRRFLPNLGASRPEAEPTRPRLLSRWRDESDEAKDQPPLDEAVQTASSISAELTPDLGPNDIESVLETYEQPVSPNAKQSSGLFDRWRGRFQR